MSVEGEGAIYGVPLTSAHAVFTTAGTFHETGTLGFDSFGLTIGGTLDATTDLATGTTSYFLSARMGCQVLHPLFGLDLAALCVKQR